LRAPSITDVGVEGNIRLACGVEVTHRLQESLRIDAIELVRELFQRRGFSLGDAGDAILAAKQMAHLAVEHLPGEHARLLQDFPTVFGIGMAVEVRTLVEVALPLCIDYDAEGIIVLLELIADRQLPEG